MAVDKSTGCWNTPLMTRYLAESTDVATIAIESPKKRQRKSREQLTILNNKQMERDDGYSPRGEELARISQVTGLMPRQVTSWFSDRRRRLGSKLSSKQRETPQTDQLPIGSMIILKSQ
jgi:hypothetical protein